MQETFHRHHLIAFLVVFALIASGVGGRSEWVHTASANANTFFHCWAWSGDASGAFNWISFNSDYNSANCPTIAAVTPDVAYSVGYNGASGVLSGHAWSGSDLDGDISTAEAGLGWLSFNRSETGDPPQGEPGTFDPGEIGNPNSPLAIREGGALKGWARFLNACAKQSGVPRCSLGLDPNGGGWDGWVSLKGTNPAGDQSYGVVFDGNNLKGDAWAGNDVGWISFAAKTGEPVAYQVTGGEPVLANPTISIAGTGTAKDLVLTFVADRPEKTSKAVEIRVNKDGYDGAVSFDIESTTLPATYNGNTITLTPEFIPVIQGTDENVNLKVTLNRRIPTGTYTVNVRASFSGVGAPDPIIKDVKLRVTEVGSGFGEN